MTNAIDRRGLVVFTEDGAHLVGVMCTACGTHAFPPQLACPRCGGPTELVALPDRGQLWSWTIQHIQPKPPYRGPEPFEPFAVGYVDLGPIRVESRLAGRAADAWRIGDAVRLVTGPPDGDGKVWSYEFVPEEDAE
jgi:uncharacterized OB-fold protein